METPTLSKLQHFLTISTDSVIHSLQVKVDSLQKIATKIDTLEKTVQKTEIGTGFFSEIIGLQLGVFILILSFSSLIGWRWFSQQIDRIRAENKTYTDNGITTIENMFNNHKDEIKNDISKVIEDINIITFNVNRAMFFTSKQSKDFPYTPLSWGLSAMISLIKCNRNDKNPMIISWLHLVLDQSKLIQVGDTELKNGINLCLEMLSEIENYSELEEEQINMVKSIRETLLHLAYTKPEPPEDLADGHATTPPPPMPT